MLIIAAWKKMAESRLKHLINQINSNEKVLKIRGTLNFIHLLQKQEFLKFRRINASECVILKSNINAIQYVDRLNLKATEVLEFALRILPTITGIVVLSTHQGLITHIQANDKRIGGRVIAIIY